MQRGHFVLGRHHVAGSVHQPARTEVQLVEQRGTLAAVVAALVGRPALRPGKSAAVVLPRTDALVVAEHTVHLSRHQHLVQVMHLFVGKSVVILPVGMLVERARRIELEAVDALVHKIGQVVEPVLLARLRAAFARCDNILFDNALVVVDAEPQAQLIAQPVQAADEAGFPFVLRELFLDPVAFGREEFVIPALFGREVVIFRHPLRFDPHHVTRHLFGAETHRVVHHLELVLLHMTAERKAVHPARQHVGAAGKRRVEAEGLRHGTAHHHVKVSAGSRIINKETLLVVTGYVEIAAHRGIVENAPPRRAHHERNRCLGDLVAGPHAQHLAAVLDMVTARAAAAVKTLVIGQGKAQDAVAAHIAHFGLLLLSPVFGRIADNRLVAARLLELLVERLPERRDERSARGEVRGLAQDGVSLQVGHADAPVLPIDAYAAGRSTEHHDTALIALGHLHRLPVGFQQSVTLQQRLGKGVGRRHANPENPVAAHVDTHLLSAAELQLIPRGCGRPRSLHRQQCGNHIQKKSFHIRLGDLFNLGFAPVHCDPLPATPPPGL